MKCSFFLLSSNLLLFACNSGDPSVSSDKIPFDKKKWAIMKDDNYPYRNSMLEDLVFHYLVHGMKKDSIFQLLGPPNRSDSSYFFYTVWIKRLGNLPVPLHVKSLVIKLDKDSLLQWRKIHD